MHDGGSLPMRERELKLRDVLDDQAEVASLPMRERELKLHEPQPAPHPARVAPHAGARIETSRCR